MKKGMLSILVVLLLACVLFMFHTSRSVRNEFLLADSLMTEHADSSFSILQSIKSLDRLSGENQALYALLMTQAMFKKHLPPESDSLIRIAADYYKESKDSLRKGWTYFYCGRIYQNLDEEKKALDYYQKASIAASVTENYKLLDLIYNYWGLLLQKKKPYDDGIEKLKKSLEYSGLRKDTLSQIHVLMDLGWSYVWKEDYSKSLLFYQRAMLFAKAKENESLLSSIYNGLSVLYCQQQKDDQALQYTDKSLALKQDSTQKKGLYFLKGSIFLNLGQYDSARYYIEKRGLGNDFYSKASYYNNNQRERYNHYADCSDSNA